MDIATVSKLMMLDGYPDSTIDSTIKRLKNLAAECNLREPNTVRALLWRKKLVTASNLIYVTLTGTS
jgi:hypothetical protein